MPLKLLLFLNLCLYKLSVYVAEGQFCVVTLIIGMFQQADENLQFSDWKQAILERIQSAFRICSSCSEYMYIYIFIYVFI